MFVSANTTPFLAETFPYQDKRCVKWCVAVVRATFDVDAQGNCTVCQGAIALRICRHALWRSRDHLDARRKRLRPAQAKMRSGSRCPARSHPDVRPAKPWRSRCSARGSRSGPSSPVSADGTEVGRHTGSRPEPFTRCPWLGILPLAAGIEPTGSRQAPQRRRSIRSALATWSARQIDGTSLPVSRARARACATGTIARRPIGFGPVPRFAKNQSKVCRDL